jgi:hypothetical protein
MLSDKVIKALPELTGYALKVLLALRHTANKGRNKSFVTMRAREIQEISGLEHRSYVVFGAKNLEEQGIVIKENCGNQGIRYILLDDC